MNCHTQNLINFKVNDKFGYKDSTGKIVLQATYEFPAEFENGIAVIVEDHYIILLNNQGKEIGKYENGYHSHYNFFHKFSNGLLATYDSTSKKYGYIDMKGEWIIKPNYFEVTDFQYQFANVWEDPDIHVDINSDCGTPVLHPKWGVIDKNQRYVIRPKYAEPGIIEKDKIVFQGSDGKKYVYDLNGWRIK